jgi:pimeloyl-ACP methyl ester carboxylesterase
LSVLIGPVMAFNENVRKALNDRAALVSEKGMSAIATQVATGGTSQKTSASRPLAKAFVLASLLAASPTGYSQACRALATAEDPSYGKISAPTLIIAASEDKTAPDATTEKLAGLISNAKRVIVGEVGHWLLVEDVEAVKKAFQDFVGVANGH